MLLAEKPLYSLALDVVRKADQGGLTPVIAVDGNVTLSDMFVGEFIRTLYGIAERPIRIEALLRSDGIFGFWRARQTDRLANRLTRLVPQELVRYVSVERRTVLSRAAGPTRPLAMGIAGVFDPLPDWACAMRVTHRPIHMDDFQLIPAA